LTARYFGTTVARPGIPSPSVVPEPSPPRPSGRLPAAHISPCRGLVPSSVVLPASRTPFRDVSFQ